MPMSPRDRIRYAKISQEIPKVDLIDESTPSLEARSCPSKSRNVVVATVRVKPKNARYE